VSRGDLICRPQNRPLVERDLDAIVCWTHETPSTTGGRYVVKHTTRTTRGVLSELLHRIDVDTLHRDEEAPGARPQRHRPHHPAHRRRRWPSTRTGATARPARSCSSTRRRTTRSPPG
jgi:hypothetical protein